MMLADHGAEVIRIQRPGTPPDAHESVLLRNRRTVEIDLKTETGIAQILDLTSDADGLIEGYRPGVTERLGLGPDTLLARNPRLVYGRMTGWGQEGPLAKAAGHDINYIALAGVLSAMGRAGDKPTPPINLVGDFGGGGLLLAFGMVAALCNAQRTGLGQVIDCAMIDGAALLASMIWGFRGAGEWADARGSNLIDTGSHFYDTYETSDGGYIAIAAIEAPFYALLREKLGLSDDPEFDPQMDPASWPGLKDRLTDLFKRRTRQEWCDLLEGTDACFSPVLSMAEAPSHPHNRARGNFFTLNGVVQPMPAPRFSRTPASIPVANAPLAPEV